MKITRKSFMAGVSAAVLADWAKPVFAGDAPRPFGAGARVLERVGTSMYCVKGGSEKTLH